jgi:hypothetical protein
MVEPVPMRPGAGGYDVHTDPGRLRGLVRQATELGADLIKCDPLPDAGDFARVVRNARVPVLVRGGGRITDAELTSEEGIAARADVTVDGSAAAADASIVVSEATVEDVVAATVEKRFGINVTSTSLVAPDIIRIKAGTSTVDGHLAIDGDAITLDTPLGSVAILRLDPAFPLRLRSATVEAGALHIDGTLDANTLIGG